MENFIKTRKLIPFRKTYFYIDYYDENINCYQIDKLLTAKDVIFKFKLLKKALVHPDYKFSICLLDTWQWHESDIEQILKKLDRNMTILYGNEYLEFLKYFNNFFDSLLSEK